MSGFFQIGIVTASHGIKGELRVLATTDEPDRFFKLKELLLELNDKKNVFQIEKMYTKNRFLIIKFLGIDSINDAVLLKGARILIPDELALPLGENEYFIRDLYGIDVYSDSNVFLGELIDVISTGANDVYVIEDIANKQLLIPAIKQCILNVDIRERKMIVKLLEEA